MFKVITNSLKPKATPTEEDLKKINSYIFCRWLSGSPYTILAANQINMYSDIPIENQFYMINYSYAGKIKYIPFPKNVGAEKSKEVEWVATHFKINETLAKEYIELMAPEELNNIVQMYTELELKK